MKKIGLTGGIGSGKTTVGKIFKVLTVPVFNSDDEAKLILQNDKIVHQQLIALFGASVMDKGSPDKAKIAAIVFKDKSQLEKLNQIIHPKVNERFQDWCSENKLHDYVLKEAAILFESSSYKKLDAVINVSCPIGLRLQRTMQRNAMSEEAFMQRVQNQMSDEDRNALSDFVIKNDEKSFLIEQVLAIHHQLKRKDA